MARFMAHATHGREDPERATLPFIVANVAASADQEAIVLLTIEGVWLATKGYADESTMRECNRSVRSLPPCWRTADRSGPAARARSPAASRMTI